MVSTFRYFHCLRPHVSKALSAGPRSVQSGANNCPYCLVQWLWNNWGHRSLTELPIMISIITKYNILYSQNSPWPCGGQLFHFPFPVHCGMELQMFMFHTLSAACLLHGLNPMRSLFLVCYMLCEVTCRDSLFVVWTGFSFFICIARVFN